MEMQPRYMTKEELHKMIDEYPENEIMVLTYKKESGISDIGKMTKKSKTQRLVDKSNLIILMDTKPVRRVDLEGNFSRILSVNRENTVKSILLPQIE